MDDPADELRRVTQRFFRKFGALSAECTPCGKPLSMGHAHALMVLLGRGELSQQTLGAELCIDKSNVARLCAKMVRAGHAKQLQSDHDGRSRLVSFAAGGARIAQEVEVASRERDSPCTIHRLPCCPLSAASRSRPSWYLFSSS